MNVCLSFMIQILSIRTIIAYIQYCSFSEKIASTWKDWSKFSICHWCHRIPKKVGFNIRKLSSEQDHFNVTSIWSLLNVDLRAIPVLVRNIILQYFLYQFPHSIIKVDISWRQGLKIHRYNVQQREHDCRISTKDWHHYEKDGVNTRFLQHGMHIRSFICVLKNYGSNWWLLQLNTIDPPSVTDVTGFLRKLASTSESWHQNKITSIWHPYDILLMWTWAPYQCWSGTSYFNIVYTNSHAQK